MKNKQFSVAVTAICLVLGIIMGVQFNTVKQQQTTSENQRLSELTTTLKQVQQENEMLTQKVSEQEATIKDYESGLDYKASVQSLQKENEQLRIFAGLTEATGAGLRVTMNDSSTKNGGDSNAYLVHAEDILAVINELNVGGAEAISVNGQRIIGQSSVTCAGSIVMINGTRVAAPFEFLAIGESDVLQSALKFPGGVVDNLAPWGIEINMKKETQISVAAYTQTTLWRATPLKESDGL